MNDALSMKVAESSQKLPREYFDSNHRDMNVRDGPSTVLIEASSSLDHLTKCLRVQ